MAKRDYYDVLGISKSATSDEVRSAFRKLARKFHPDANKTDPKGAEVKFREINEAYEVLGDEQKRKQYDEFGHAGPMPPPYGNPGSGGDPYDAFRRAAEAGRAPGGRQAYQQWGAGPGVSVEDINLGEGGGFAEMFEQMFNRGGSGGATAGGAGNGRAGGRRSRARQVPRGDDIEYPVTLTFAQAARGTTLPLQINRDGHIETIELKVPAGVKEGSRIRIRGQGQRAGGEPGDLYIVAKVVAHPYFRREHLDVHLDVPISLYEAILGTKVEVPTLDGPVTLTIPPGTSSGAKLRVKGRGIEKNGERGDQIVIPRVVVPKDFSQAEKDAIAKLADARPLNARADVHW